MKNDHLLKAKWHIEEKHDGEVVVRLENTIDINTSASLYESLLPAVKKIRPPLLTLDLSLVTYLDDYGSLAIMDLQAAMVAKGGRFKIVKAPTHIKETFERAIRNRDVDCAIFHSLFEFSFTDGNFPESTMRPCCFP